MFQFLNSRVVGATFAAALVLSSAAVPAFAFDEDDMPDTKVFRGIMSGLGLSNDKDAIEYRERSPLVIPPSRSLVAPEAANASARPDWPVDPDVKRAKEAKEKSKKVQRNAIGKTGDTWYDEGRPISRDELERGRTAVEQRNGGAMTEQDSAKAFLPSALGSPGGFGIFGRKDESAKFTAEPPRASLTDPPAGYQTPSPNQPYGVGKAKATSKAVDYQTEHGTQNW